MKELDYAGNRITRIMHKKLKIGKTYVLPIQILRGQIWRPCRLTAMFRKFALFETEKGTRQCFSYVDLEQALSRRKVADLVRNDWEEL